MTPDRMEWFRNALLQLEADLTAELSAEGSADSSITPDNAIGRLTRMEAIQSQAMGQAGKRRIEQRIARIKRALERIEKGQYGSCTSCRDPIPVGRLEIMPESALCVACAQKMR